MTATATRGPSGRYALLDQLRGVAAALVVFDHLVGQYLRGSGQHWVPYNGLERFVIRPLGIIQDFGAAGVAMFFLISGFVITAAAYREERWEFGAKRLLRIYPPLWTAVLLMLVLDASGGAPAPEVPGFWAWPLSFTLLNYVVTPQFVPLGVGWTLAIEMLFYTLVWASMRAGRRLPFLFPVILLGCTTLLLVTARLLGSSWFLLAVLASYLPLLGLGQVTFLVVSRRLPVRGGVLLGTLMWVAFISGLDVLQPGFLAPDNLLPVSVLLAGIAFGLAVVLEGRRAATPWLGALAKRSYSLYLLHPAALALLTALDAGARLHYTVALALTLVALAAVTEASYRLVEKRSLVVAGRVCRQRRKRVAAAAATLDRVRLAA